MTRPRVPLGLETSRTTLDRAVALELGQKVREARTSRGLGIPEMSKTLMLSPAQLTALEQVQPEAFYGAEFYVNALKKYLRYFGLEASEASAALVKPVAPTKKPAPFRRPKPAEAAGPSRAGRAPALAPTVVAAAVAASAVAGWYLLAPGRSGATATSTSGRTGTAKPSPEAAPTPPPPPAEPVEPVDDAAAPGLDPAAAAVSAVNVMSATLAPVMRASTLPAATDPASASSRFGSITVAESTWLFVRYADNGTDERRIGAGTAFLLRGLPVYIAVGEADGTVIVVNGRRVDASPFVTNGQIRIGKAFLGTLVAGR